ncbi:MAG TPA: hypothetical protein VFM37_04660 [Pseudonocardiaceae bacterium]|nr:hypothetical protein [Pseudonocardiaceae bacterium]
MQLRVTTGNQLGGLADRLRYAGRSDLMRELRSGIRQATAPFGEAVKLEAAATLPERGGYAETLLRALRVRTSTRTSVRAAGVTIDVSAKGRHKPRHLADLNRGRLRHPRFGDRAYWHTTRVPAGFIDRPTNELRDQVARDVRGAIANVKARIITR